MLAKVIAFEIPPSYIICIVSNDVYEALTNPNGEYTITMKKGSPNVNTADISVTPSIFDFNKVRSGLLSTLFINLTNSGNKNILWNF